ncbi:hypothetical protein D3C72_1133000 [compost metagenome]
MGTRRAGNKLPGDTRISGDQRTRQATFTGARQGHSMFRVAIRHQGGDRAKGFGRMNGRGLVRLRAEQQRRREECPRCLHVGFASETNLAARRDQQIHFFLHVGTLFGVDQRPHFDAFLRRIADHHFLKTRNQRLAHRLNLPLRDDDAANGSTFLSGFGGHLPHHFTDKQGKLRLFRGHIFAEHAAVQGIRFHRERNGFADDIRVDAQHLAGGGGAGKGHHVLTVEMIEQVARTAADQADRTLRHQTAIDDGFHHRLRHLRRGSRRFDDRRHPGKPGRGQFFQHPPTGEVKGVDMHRHAGFGGQYVSRGKAAFFRQRDQLVFRPQSVVRQFTATEAGVGKHRANPAFDIHPAVRSGRAGFCRQGVKLLFLAQQMFGDRFQHCRALDKGHGVK